MKSSHERRLSCVQSHLGVKPQSEEQPLSSGDLADRGHLAIRLPAR